MSERTSLYVFVAVICGFCLSALSGAVAAAQTGSGESAPVIISGEFPTYPDGARGMRQQGTIRIKVWTTGTIVKAMVAEPSAVHKSLIFAAERSLRTWVFRSHKPTTFYVVFAFVLDAQSGDERGNSTVTLQLPSKVEVRTRAPKSPSPAR